MLFLIAAILTGIYAVTLASFVVALLVVRYPRRQGIRPSVSIIVAARNEENSIARCLDSLVAVRYPVELLDIVIVDDRSTDKTAAIIQGYASLHSHVRYISATPGAGEFRGKTNAVTQGIEATHGEIILFTDADCRVPESWVERTVEYYVNERVGVVAGFTFLDATSQFGRMQSIDWFYLFSVAAASLRIGSPTTAVGNNLSVRRAAYDATGGYRVIPFSVTEDYALFHAIIEKTGYKALYPIDSETLVRSLPCATAPQLFNQKLRWFTGGKDMDPRNLVFFSVAFLLNVLFPLILLLGGNNEGILLLVLVKALADCSLALPAILRLRAHSLLPSFPFFLLYYYIYVLVYPPLVLLGREVTWKERRFGS